MPYIEPQVILQAKQMDLLTYLQTYEPQELVQISPLVYTTRKHDSLKISNGRWCWFSRGIGGRSALDYLIKVKGLSFLEAVEQVSQKAVNIATPPIKKETQIYKPFILPEKNSNNDRVIDYLKSRGIHPVILDYFISSNRLYEDKHYHNAVFVGFDLKGTPKYAVLRGTSAIRYIREVQGSDKHFSFSFTAENKSEVLHLYESTIDLLSGLTLSLFEGRDWKSENHLSLGGVNPQKRDTGSNSIPIALEQYLHDHKEIKTIKLHLDNDLAGKETAKAISALLFEKYAIFDESPKMGKDINEQLCHLVGLGKQKGHALGR